MEWGRGGVRRGRWGENTGDDRWSPVDALSTPFVPRLAARHRLPGDEQLGIHLVQVQVQGQGQGQVQIKVQVQEYLIEKPLEGLALQVIPQLLPALHVSEVAQVVADPVVVILLIVVQPNLPNK